MHAALTHDEPVTANRLSADVEWLARAGRGEAVAFEALMRQHNRLLFRSARGVVSDDAEAQDVVQEAWLRAFSTLASFRGDCALGTWLARIAINVALDSQRRRGRTVALDHMQDCDAEPAMEHMLAFSAPATAAPEAQAERRQTRALLQRAIDSLPSIYRSVFILRAVQEMSVAETASCLRVSDAVVKTRYLRARSMLRDALGAQVEAHALEVYAFAGERCDAVVAHVLAELQRQGRIRPDRPG
ncbi:MAG: RNA polymerase sigma factor [Burkholderiaceae bacterium]